MTTDNPKVSSYVPQGVYDHLIAFKAERGLKSISMAVTAVLEEYFGLSKATLSDATAKRLETLEGEVKSLTETVAALSQAIADLKSRSGLPVDQTELKIEPVKITGLSTLATSESASQLPVEKNDPSAMMAASSPPVENGERPTEKTSAEPIPASSPLVDKSEPTRQSSMKPLTQAALAKRLGANSSRVSQMQSKPNFSKWSSERDPDGIAWKFNSKTKRFYPQLV